MRLHRRIIGRFAPATLACLLVGNPVHAGGIAILSTVIEDNGDHDSFADSRETVQLRLLVQNTGGNALSGVTLELENVGPGGACVTDGTLVVGDLAAGETRLTDESFELVVGNLDRTGLGLSSLDPVAQALRLTVPSHPNVAVHPSEIALDLDLNVSGGAGSAVLFESFEDGLGAFEIENLDQGRSSLAASNGFRCQYLDPDNPNNNNESIPPGDPVGAEFCYFGNSALHADAVFWGLSGPGFSPLGGRGFSGFHSLYFGIDLGPPKQFTTPMGVMEAVRTTEPVELGWNGVSPTLTFKQQVSFADDTFGNVPPGETWDRGVVMVQLADEGGNPAGAWIKVYPSVNVYDAKGTDSFFGCMFDATDDGDDEDDFFNPFDPERRYGPSSTCQPAPVFARLGETSLPFAAANVGRADGPGLQGMWGIGTWIESRFDLSRFRGRQVRVRFLASAVKYGDHDTWDDIFSGANPHPGDDGWWIDDVTLTGALTTPASVASDDAPNVSLPVPSDGDLDAVLDTCDNCASTANLDQVDSDSDGTGDACDSCPGVAFVIDHDFDTVCADNCPFVTNLDQANGDGDPAGQVCDCNDADPETFPGAAEVNDGVDNQCAGDLGFGSTDEISGLAGFYNSINDNLFSWSPQAGATRYQVARSAAPDFSVGCTAFPLTTQPNHTDTTAVPPGEVRYYLVRVRQPHVGSWGTDSSGTERVVSCAL